MLTKFRTPEMVLGALFASLLWAGIWGWTDSYAPTERQKQECYDAAKKTNQKSDECKTFWEKATSDPIAFFTLVLAFSTVGVWVATIGLYFAGKRQLRLAREEFISSNRPLMKVKLVEVVEVDDEQAGVKFTVVNAGTSTAYVTGSCAKAAYFFPNDWPHPNDYGVDNAIPPRRFVTGATDTYTIHTNEPIGMIEVAAGSPQTLRFYGYIVYKDAMENVRTTYFCRAYNPGMDRFDPVDRSDYDSTD
jgi:hypothetical protein